MSHSTNLPELKYTLEGKRIWVAGHRGMVGAALLERLKQENCTLLSTPRSELDLRSQAQTQSWIKENRPDAIIVAAAKVGGIHANNTYPADFLYDNLMIQSNIIHAAWQERIEKLLFLGSSCIYPKISPQPIPEDALLTGTLEPTNEPYAVAKIAGIKLCQSYRRQHGCDFISAMPTNLYGPGDNFNLETSHVIPALIRKAHEARHSGSGKLIIWGTGKPRREFLHVHDAADALVHIMKYYSEEEHINLGTGTDIAISELVEKIKQITGFDGAIEYDTSKPDGTMLKLLDTTRLKNLCWTPNISLDEGLKRTYSWYTNNCV